MMMRCYLHSAIAAIKELLKRGWSIARDNNSRALEALISQLV